MSPLSRPLVMRIALNERGYHEGHNNDNKYAVANGQANHQPWCASFAQWVLAKGGVEHASTAFCPAAEAWYKRHGRLHSAPRVGDQFFIYFPAFGRVAHTGLVTGISLDGRTVFTIEGNSNPGGSRNGYGVVRRARPVLAQPGRTGIRSYGRPEYGKAPVTTPKPKPKLRFRLYDLAKALHLTGDTDWDGNLQRRVTALRSVAQQHGGVAHLVVLEVQHAQRAVGATPDGVWGPKSRSAFKKTLPKVQLALGVAPDGSWGPVTEAAYQAARKMYKE